MEKNSSDTPQGISAENADQELEAIDIEIPGDLKDIEKIETADEIEKEKGEDQTDKPQEITTRRFATIMNLLNSLLGAGILSVPSSFTSTGIIISIIILAAVALISHIATIMLVNLQLETESAGLDELSLNVSGKPGQVFLSVMCLIFNYASNLAYLILGGDMIISWFKFANIDISTLWRRALMMVIYSIVLPVALTIPRSLEFLSYFSSAVVVLILFFIVAVIVKAAMFFPNNPIDETVVYAKFDIGVFSAISIFGLTFSLPSSVLPIIHPYNKNYPKRKLASFVTTFVCFLVVVIPSIITYLMFGKHCDGNILNNFPDNDILITIVRIGFFFIVTFSYPIIAQIMLASWGEIIYKQNNPALLSGMPRVVVHLLTHTPSVIVSMFLPEAKPVLNVGGSLGGCIINFVYPAILWFMHYRPQVKTWSFWGCMILAGFGIITAVISTYYSVLDVIAAFKNIKV